jgi:ABC-type transporter Mla MlaB component
MDINGLIQQALVSGKHSSTRPRGVRSAAICISDKADEVCVDVQGVLSNQLIGELQAVWEASQSTMFWRRFMLAISKLEGYDSAGLALLRNMYRRGVVFSASTPWSLHLLKEICGERGGPKASGERNRK